MSEFNFRKLKVWNSSRSLVKGIYSLTASFPKEETFGLTSQLRRAAISVSSNIAEGAGRTSPKDKMRFYEMAYGSLTEVVNQLILACDIGFLTENDITAIQNNAEEIGRMLSGIRRSVQKMIENPTTIHDPEFEYI